jgi:hypothetical protein
MTITQTNPVEEALGKRRLLVMVGRKGPDEPRMVLDWVEWVDGGEPIASFVLRGSDEGEYLDLLDGGGVVRQWSRFGTWRRYLEEVKTAHALVRFVNWTLTPEESAIMQALDGYVEQAPRRLAAA